ncbi:HAD hydrolase-like protein [uncultured Fibrobacter sp.]|uniref:HAD-IIA family hydrolase n=1 Tax=uncultured Fibrobacter sp. TaxID=261512 RepID=UPI0025D46336|nr:HAD hydrolase-like protein [uncultured Fibrobacter sp.]
MESLELEIYGRYRALVEKSGAFSGRTSPDGEPSRVRLSDIIDKYDAFCFDGYGTLYNRGDFVYLGAKEWFGALRRAGKQIRLVTNAASNLDQALAEEADARGFDFTVAETISSGSLLKGWLSGLPAGGSPFGAGREVYYIGRATGVNVLAECGIAAVENPVSPVVAISSSTATDEMYAQAVAILRRPGALLLVLNPDAWAPRIDGTRAPVSGELCERLRRETGCAAEYFGKPFPGIWQKVRATLPAGAKAVMIGDTLGTDVYGAYVAGFDSALVVGRNEPAAELAADEKLLGVRPTYYLEP